MHLVCNRCNHYWQYAGDKHRTSCPKCKTSITVHQHQLVPQQQQQQDHDLTNHVIKEVKMPKSLWKDVRLSQRFMALDNMGEKWVMLKVDSEGILSL